MSMRRRAVVSCSALAVAVPLIGAASASAAPVSTNVNLGAGGPAVVDILGQTTNINVLANATASINLNAALPIQVTPAQCPAGTTGILLNITSTGAPITGTLNVNAPANASTGILGGLLGATATSATSATTSFGISLPAGTGQVGVCVAPPQANANVGLMATVDAVLGNLLGATVGNVTGLHI